MGRSTTPKYVVEMKHIGQSIRSTPMAWNVKSGVNRHGCGKPTDENLAKYMQDFNESLKVGGVSHHLGYTSLAISAIIRENGTGGNTLAEWYADLDSVTDVLITIQAGRELSPDELHTIKWVNAVLANDEASTDEELVEHFVKSGIIRSQAEKYVSQRQAVFREMYRWAT